MGGMGASLTARGKIIKGIAGFYYVHATDGEVYECRAKGIFRKEGQKPLVGDEVQIDIIDEAEHTGNVARLLPRRNMLVRPAVANVDQALMVFSVTDPVPNFQLLDKMLAIMGSQRVQTAICFSKSDLGDARALAELRARYEKSGNRLVFSSIPRNQGLEELCDLLAHKTTAVAGPSGVGKSSLVNRLQPSARMETGEISGKTSRGKHTTRHAQLIHVREDTYLVDTPGFTSLSADGIPLEELAGYFPEFSPYVGECRFQGCSHIHEPDCGVKEALSRGEIPMGRYESYVSIYQELQEKKRY